LTGLPNLKQLEQFVDATGVRHLVQKSAFTLLFIAIVNMKQINASHGRTVGDAVLLHVVRHATAGLRLADILFRYGSDEFVALLNDTNSESARIVGSRIREGVRNNALALEGGQTIPVDVTVTAVSSPIDGESLPSLVGTARSRIRDTGVSQESSPTR
jgi:diguanylate cyclase (GGDEF)-like protein